MYYISDHFIRFGMNFIFKSGVGMYPVPLLRHSKLSPLPQDEAHQLGEHHIADAQIDGDEHDDRDNDDGNDSHCSTLLERFAVLVGRPSAKHQDLG